MKTEYTHHSGIIHIDYGHTMYGLVATEKEITGVKGRPIMVRGEWDGDEEPDREEPTEEQIETYAKSHRAEWFEIEE